MNISATCAACGSLTLRIPDDDDADQMIRCAECGADVGDKQAVNQKLRARAEEEAAKVLADFKKKLSKMGFK